MHYHALNGLHGYMPDNNELHRDYDSAVESLSQLFELGKKRRKQLQDDGYLELNNHRDGAEYCEVIECYEQDCEQELDKDGY